MPLELDGTVCSGIGEGANFTRLDWVVREFREKLGFVPYPGTLNLRLNGDAWAEARSKLTQAAGIAIDPAPGFCAAKCFAVLINDCTPGAIVLPDVSGYPADKIEIVAPLAVRQKLKLQDGDCVKLRIDIKS